MRMDESHVVQQVACKYSLKLSDLIGCWEASSTFMQQLINSIPAN